MATTISLTGRLADITSRPIESTTTVTVKAPSYAPGPGIELTTSQPVPVDVQEDGAITVDVVEGVGWLYLEGDGWTESVRFVAAEGMTTLWEAVVNALPQNVNIKRILTELYEAYAQSQAGQALPPYLLETALEARYATKQEFLAALQLKVEPIVASYLGSDRVVQDAAAAAISQEIAKQTQFTSQIGSADRADFNKIVRTNETGNVWIATKAITQDGHPTNKAYVTDAIKKAVEPLEEDAKTHWLGSEDLNTVTEKGSYSQYWVSGAKPELNYPTSKPGILTVDTNRTRIVQQFVPLDETMAAYRRYATQDSGGSLTWKPWVRQGWQGYDLGSKDLDDVIEPGVYAQPETRFAAAAMSYPVSEIGVLEVLANGDRITQRYTRTVGAIASWHRYSYIDSANGKRVWRPWDKIGGQAQTAVSETEILVTADYTGKSDAQPAIQEAIDQGVASGKTVRLLPGILRVDRPIKVKSKLTLRGSGAGKTIIRPQGQCNGMDMVRDGSILRNVTITDLEIDGVNQTMPSTGYTPTVSKGIFLERIREMEMRNLVLRNTAATGLGIDHVTGVIENVWAIRCGRLNSGNRAGGSGIGIGVGWLDAEWEPLTIANCHTEGNGRYGIFIESQSHNVFPSGITITGCTAKGNKDGIGDDGSTGTVITGCHVTGNSRAGIDVGEGTMPEAHPGVFSKVIGNHVENNGYVGILATANADGALQHVQILDNTVIGGAGDGIKLQVKTTDSSLRNVGVKVSGNEVGENAGVGILLDGATSTLSVMMEQFWISGNRMWGNTGGAIRVQATTRNLVIDRNHAWDTGEEESQAIALSVENTHEGLRVLDDNIWFSGAVIMPA